ncbi:hypothetical protein Lal_00025218 [Lupinus albus]|uniref:Putative C2 domain-containing protein n=1 Tax=Lupinus albus TaxID=3870 RepID=A0A6A5NY81_LUPAL|nr:putative C2 domain-containing protein [Lupinus albus]KAF1889888.1 hypothetical protein Lal_00025218 [Lupinus albus]
MQQPSKSRTLEVTVLSAENLRINGNPATKNIYVVVRAESITSHTTATTGDGSGGGFHSWNEKLTVEMAMHAKSITFEVRCKTEIGVRDVGVARIAVSDFFGGLVPDQVLKFFSYGLRDWDGLRNGVINFSVRVVEPAVEEVEAVADSEKMVGATSSSSNNVVLGIPICWNNSTSSNI